MLDDPASEIAAGDNRPLDCVPDVRVEPVGRAVGERDRQREERGSGLRGWRGGSGGAGSGI
jgi:hypothetical protein